MKKKIDITSNILLKVRKKYSYKPGLNQRNLFDNGLQN